jgi:hypothetical protein
MGSLNFMQTLKKPLKKSDDLFSGFLSKPVVKSYYYWCPGRDSNPHEVTR